MERSPTVREIDGLKVVDAEPGAPLPPGVPAWAQRCEVVEILNRSASARRWLIRGGLLGAAAGLAALSFAPWDVPVGIVLGASLLALVDGFWPGKRTTIMPSAEGRFLAYADGVLPRRPTPREEASGCIASGLGVFIMLGGVAALVSGEQGAAAFTLLGGWWLYRAGRTGEMAPPDLPPATRRFLELADPSRALAANDPVTSPAEPVQIPAEHSPPLDA